MEIGSDGDRRADGGVEREGKEKSSEPYYRRSCSLRSLNAIPSSTLTSILVKKVRVKQGTLRYRRNDGNKCVDVSKDYKNYFSAIVLEKINTKRRGPEIYPAEGEFYPALHRLLTARRNWRPTFQFRGPSTFMLGVMEWTKRVLTHFEEPLKQAGIFGVVGVSQFPYHFDANVWWASCELWGPLTNTLHHGAGKVGISLYDLEQVGGLPILGDIYEKFLPQNKDLVGHNKYPTAVAELLGIHAELCEFHKTKHIYYDLWLDHFYREYLVHFVYGEQTDFGKEKVETTKRSPLRISLQKRMANLNITTEGELAAFLAFWLSRFVLPDDKEVIRPETFVMAALMASGLGDAASNPDYPGKANTIVSIHYVIDWLAELFLCLYHCRPDSDCPDDFPTLVCYARLLGSKLCLPQATHICRDGRYLSLSASSYREYSRNGRDVIDIGLLEEDSKLLLSIWSTVLPVRVGAKLILEPYYRNRFARQFGFDQGVPSNRLSFIGGLRQQRSMMDLAQAHTDLQSIPTSLASLFYNLKEDWVRESILKGVEVIIDIISNHGSARELLASKARVFQSLSALYSMIDIYNLGTIEICWLSSKIQEIFGVAETAVKIEDLVDIDRVKALSNQDLTCSSEITRIEDQLNNLSSEALKLKVKEQEILREEERIQGKLKSSLDLKKREAEQVKADLAEAGFSKLQDLEKEKNHLKSLIGSVISFKNI
ncbi:hypothetical protein Cgig2_004304 [Carnegiea gigantea]|uniref:Aminotransferase-like plant mobile domain-containing protein n=1 Tax=Carnegiea gigantea TaxID=171969 RepID=A0A9Q1K155_9CARY|nr:hypothetical protein Cgig2_004304 [Carnegiea gigantea]